MARAFENRTHYLSKEAPFRKYKITEEESFAQGFETGKAWNSDWIPGGPYVSAKGHHTDVDWIAYCEQTKKNCDAYLRGFHAAIAVRLEMGDRTVPKKAIRSDPGDMRRFFEA